MSLYTIAEPAENGANPAESAANDAAPAESSAGIYTAEDAKAARRRRGKRSRAKGAAWQAQLAKRWRDAGLWLDAASTQGAQTRSGRKLGKTPPDIEGTPYWVEAKHTRQTPLAAIRQAVKERDAAGDTRTPIAVHRAHGCGADGAVVVMRLEDFEALVRAMREGWEAP